jgi:hypothetical protein
MYDLILDPTGQTVPGMAEAVHAQRPADLRGVRVGLLDNTKQNADLLLREIGALLESEYGATVAEQRTKHVFALPLDEDVLKQMSADCDVVVVGVGDCGSCSASAVADGIAFEREGVASAVICSDAFDATARAMAEVHGSPDYQYLSTPHPVASLGVAQVKERALRLLQPVVSRLCEGGA